MKKNQALAVEIRALLTGTREEIEKAVEFFYLTEQPKIFKELADYCTPAELEEIFSDSLLVLLKKVTIIKKSPISYFRQICRNKASNLYRFNNKKDVSSIEEESLIQLKDAWADLDRSCLENDEAQVFLLAVELLMSKIGEDNRNILIQRYFNDWSNQEIAEEQGIEYQSAANKLYRSIKKIREVLEKEPMLKEILEQQLYEAF